MSVRWVGLVVVVVLMGCGSDGGSGAPTEADGTTTTQAASTDAASFDLCTTRLAYSDALTSLDTPPFGDAGALEVLREIVPPGEFADDWDLVMAVAEEAVARGVETEEVSPEIFDPGLAVVAALDRLVVTSPCEPDGLDPEFGCTELDACAQALVDGEGDAVATGFVVADVGDLEPHSFECRQLEVSGGLPYSACRFDSAAGEFSAEFASTSDGRLFAWVVTP